MANSNEFFQKEYISGKGIGIIAIKEIKTGTELIVDDPITITAHKIYSDIFQLLYKMLTNDQLFNKFLKLVPKDLSYYKVDIDKINLELTKVKKNNKEMYQFFIKNYTFDDILLYCAKYMCNAFDYNNKPAFLFTGTLLNHSCFPNVIFGPKNNKMVFIAVRNISKGEEICDNYINITMNVKNRQKHLLEQYGFECKCNRCLEVNKNRISEFNKLVVDIEKERLTVFGVSKAICL